MKWPLIGREADLDHALELIESGVGVAILGSAGVGKSRLLGEVVDRAQRTGMAVVSAIATESTRSIPFAPFVALLPTGPTHDRLAMLGTALSAIEAQTGEGGLLLAVDDAQHLDDGSLGLLINSVRSSKVTVCLTVRASEPLKADLVDLWTNGIIERIDLHPLDRESSRLLVEATLGAIDSDLDDELWRLAQGNPLVIHEVIEGAVGKAIEQDDRGVWIRKRELTDSTRLADLVSSRLASLPDHLRLAMDVVAVGTPLALELLRKAIGGAVDELDGRRMLSTVDISGEAVVVVGHPLYGEILKDNLGDVRAQHAYRTLVQAAITPNMVTDVLRAAIWQRECGTVLSIELALQGATEALIRHDPALAEEIVRPLDIEDDSVALVLGRALSYQQRYLEAEEVLGGREPTESHLLAEICSVRAQNMGFGLGRIGEARDLLEKAARRVGDSQLRGRLNNERAMISAIYGDFVDARRTSQEVLSDDAPGDVASVAAFVTLTLALTMTADVDGFNAVIDDALHLARTTRSELPFAEDQIRITQMISLLHEGRIAAAVSLGQEAIGQGERGTAMKPTWLSAFGVSLDLAGRLHQAALAAESALALYADGDPFGLEWQSRGILALAHGQMGDVEAGLSLEGVDPAVRAPRLAVWVDRGRAWTAAAQGRVTEAAEAVVSAGRNAVDAEHIAWGVLCFHDAIRFGQAHLVIEDLGSLDFSRGAHLMEVMKDHGELLVDRNAGGLTQLAARFMRMGAPLLAAEAWAQASGLFAADKRQVDATRVAVLSMAAEMLCESAMTPALKSRPASVSLREMDVALDAIAGRTSPEIAADRFISVRTVDNHLRSVYRKLEVGGRDELRQVMAPVLAASDRRFPSDSTIE